MPAQHICKPKQTRAGVLLAETAGLVCRCAGQAFNKMRILPPFVEYWSSGCCDIPVLKFEVFFHCIIGGRLYLKYFYSLVWSHKIRAVFAEIFHFSYLRSPSIILLEVVFIRNIYKVQFGQMSLSLNLGKIGPVVAEIFQF